MFTPPQQQTYNSRQATEVGADTASTSYFGKQDAIIAHIVSLRDQAVQALQANNVNEAFKLLNEAKRLRIPVENIDYLRAMTFLKMNNGEGVVMSVQEELRHFPENKNARSLLDSLQITSPELRGSDEFKTLCTSILPHTMVSIARLQAMYEHAVDICKNGPAGNFVECGVAGGGTSGLLSAVIKKYAPDRHLFACDSFSGMPEPTEQDKRAFDGLDANHTGWGAGTCAAPETSVLGLCDMLGTRDMITTVKGYFEQTLLEKASTFGPIAFLHMDGDWYSSTMAILDNLYDRLVPDAYVQVDDFGFWAGCRKAIEEFCQKRGISLTVTQIDHTGVWFVK